MVFRNEKKRGPNRLFVIFFLCGIYPLIHSLVNLEKKNIFLKKEIAGHDT